MRKIIYKAACILNTRMKIELMGVFFMTTIGALLETLGVSIITPLINIALEPTQMESNEMCIWVMGIFEVKSVKAVLIILIGVIVIVYILKNIYLAGMNSFIYRYAMNVRRKTCSRLMKNYIEKPYEYFLQNNSAELIRSVNSDAQAFYEVLYNFLLLLSNAITVIALGILLIYTNLYMTVTVVVLVGGVSITVLRALQQKSKGLGEINQKLQTKTIQALQESFSGIKEIKILHCEEAFREEYDRFNFAGADTQRKAQLIGVLPKYLIETLAVGSVLAVMAVGVITQDSYVELFSQLSLFAVAAFRLLPNFNSIYTYSNTIMYNKASIDILYREFSAEKKIRETECRESEKLSFENEIKVDNITFAYQGVVNNVLEEVNLTIKKGQSVALVGESGGGKTTLADIILGLLEPQRGSIVVDGIDIRKNMNSWKSKIGYIPQSIYLKDDSIRNNIAYGVRSEEIDDNMVLWALEKAKLRKYVESLPKGVDTMVGEQGICISGGQRQRIGIARALYRDPEILVFDEATSALDNETEKEIIDAIEGLHGSKTMIMIAHRLSTIENCDYIYRVENKCVRLERGNVK